MIINMDAVELKRYIANYKHIQEIVKRMEKQKVNWETDINKMDFSLLKGNPLSNEIKKDARVEYRDVETHGITLEDLMGNPCGIKRVESLLSLIEQGINLIPPTYRNVQVIIDGKEADIDYYRYDGTHRLALAHRLRLEQIPTIIIDQKLFKFTVNLWNFDFNGEIVEIYNSNNERYKIDCTRWNFGSVDGKIEFYQKH